MTEKNLKVMLKVAIALSVIVNLMDIIRIAIYG